MAESSTITREMIEAAAKALYQKDRGVPDDAWERDLPESTMELWRGYARAALTASAAAMFGAKRQTYYSGACLGLDGMGANLRFSDGSLELVFKDEELDFINEEGRDLYISRLAASEVIALRQWLIDYLPAAKIVEDKSTTAPDLAHLSRVCARAIADANITNCHPDEARPVVQAILAALATGGAR